MSSVIQNGSTALALAAIGHTDCARLLIESGADKEAKDNVRSVAFCAGVSFWCAYLLVCTCIGF